MNVAKDGGMWLFV